VYEYYSQLAEANKDGWDPEDVVLGAGFRGFEVFSICAVVVIAGILYRLGRCPDGECDAPENGKRRWTTRGQVSAAAVGLAALAVAQTVSLGIQSQEYQQYLVELRVTSPGLILEPIEGWPIRFPDLVGICLSLLTAAGLFLLLRWDPAGETDG
jgi:hypothetical protein